MAFCRNADPVNIDDHDVVVDDGLFRKFSWSIRLNKHFQLDNVISSSIFVGNSPLDFALLSLLVVF